MSVIMVIIDGAVSSDYKECKNINYIKKYGKYGCVNNTPDGFDANSLTCIMHILGVDKERIPSGRAYLEALAIDEEIDNGDLLFRCNNVDIENEILVSGCSNEMKFPVYISDNIKIIRMGGYKNILKIRNGRKEIESINTYPPHENIGKEVSKVMPTCDNKKLQDILRKLVLEYHLFPWGEAIKEEIPSFREIHNQSGAIICSTEIVKGIGKAMKMYCPDIPDTTADIDTDLIAKGRSALKLIKDYDFVLLHVNGSDESGHRRKKEEKINFINRIDKELIELLINNIDYSTSLIVTSDHGTSAETGKHINGLVDYFVLNGNEGEDKWLKR